MAETPELDRIVSMRRGGATQQAIADDIGKSRSYVQKVLARRNVAIGRRAEQPDKVMKVSTVAASDWAVAEGSAIAAANGEVLGQPDNVGEWSSYGLEGDTWKALGKNLSLPVLSAIAPGPSRAIWDYLRMADPGHEITCYKVGTDEDVEDERAREMLDLFIAERVNPRFVSTKGMFQQMFMGELFRGAACAQLITDDAVRVPLEILVPDPAIITFKPVPDEIAGMVWEPGITIDGKWNSVASSFFHYIPVDPLPGQPYGRSMIAPTAFPSIFIIGLLYDLRRVVAQQGYTRPDVKVMAGVLKQSYLETEDAKFRDIIEQMVEQVAANYATLQPDDAFVHTDSVEVDVAKGAIDSGVIGGAVQLIEVLERMEVQALKTMPILMGIPEGTSEANANRQWEIWAQGVKSMQHPVEVMAQNIFQLALQIQGIQCRVKVRFSEIRSAELLRDETTAQVRYNNAAFAEDRGWIDADEAAETAVGHPATGTKAGTAPDPGNDDITVEEDEGPGEGSGGEEVNAVQMGMRRPNRHHRSTVNRRKVDRAIDTWHQVMRDYPERSMLYAERVTQFESIPDDAAADWYWVEETRQFVYRKVDVLDSTACRDILDVFRTKMERRMIRTLSSSELAQRSSRSVLANISDVMKDGWTVAEEAMLAGIILGRGGRDGMDTDAYGDASDLLDEQEKYWSRLHDDALAEGGHVAENVYGILESRMPLYVGASALFYERGRSKEWGLSLPQSPPLHPGCDCYMEYGEDLLGAYARWMPQGDTCPECQSVMQDYQPYRGN